MNTLELSKAIGRVGLLRTGSFKYEVKITDAKTAYGNVRYLVTPVSGTGSVWVDSNRVQFTDNSCCQGWGQHDITCAKYGQEKQ